MAKRKGHKQKSAAPEVAGAGGGRGAGCRKHDANSNGALLLVVAAMLIPVAVLIKAQFDAMTNEFHLANNSNPTPSAKSVVDNNDDFGQSETKTTPARNLPQQEQVDLSKLSSWDVTTHFSKTYDSRGLSAYLKQRFDSNERAYDPSKRKWYLESDYKARGGGFDRTARHKLLHDLEQFDYFLRSDKVSVGSPEAFQTIIPQFYRETLDRLDQAAERGDFDEKTEFYIFQEEDQGIMAFYNRMMLSPNIGRAENSGPLLSQRDWGKVERQWMGEDISYPHPGIVVIDNLLSPQTLQVVRDYLLVSTFWYQCKTPEYGNYVGAYLHDGMNDKVMIDIAYELHKSMPRVMKDHHMKEMWSYKYESSSNEDEERTGIHTHADDAMVNVNLWLTPDDANLDPNSGGLVVYTVKPPREWDFRRFNSNWKYVDEHLLRPSGYANVTIPYRQNRAVIFDSFLFHKTDTHRFKQGYENRRINLTFLYGDKQSMDTSEEL